ncbi:hypothetical protein LA080_007643 [Diaporthe eres]|nr:hypothetical protein LA080_007643 [Diaporthe eres]
MAERNGLEQDAFRLVRNHSLQVAENLPGNEVAQALGDFETHERAAESQDPVREWQRWLNFDELDTNDDIAVLQKECKELVQQVIRSTLDSREAQQQSGLGRAKQQFFSFCDTLTAYSSLFSLIPQGSLYTSLFVGVISSLVKASARHDQNGEGFSRALAEISADMNFSQRQGSIHPTNRMKHLVILLYIRYSKFLCHAMSWYHSRWGRFKAAMDQSYYGREVREKVNRIKDVVKDIEREASLETQGILGQTHKTVTHLEHIIAEVRRQNQIADQNRDLSNLDVSQKLDRIWLAIGEMGHNLAASTVSRQLYNSQLAIAQGSASEDEMRAEESRIHTGAVIVHTRQEIEEASRPLMKFIGTYDTGANSAYPPYTSAGARQVTGQIVTRLQTWISEPKSQILCVISPPSSANRQEATIAAQHIVSVLQNADIPHLAVAVGRLEIGPEVLNSTSQHLETARLVILLYSFIRQLTLLVPKAIEEASNITSLLESLDGTAQSIPSALQAFQALLRHAPSLLVCVIDGLQLLDHPDLEQYVNDILSILRTGNDGRVLKVLLTSEGFFSSGANLTVDERLDCLHSPRRGPGGGRPGARNLSDVSISF